MIIGEVVVVSGMAGLGYLVAGSLMAPIDEALHMAFIGLGAAFLFPSLVCGVGFTSSLAGGRPRSGASALAIIVALVAALSAPPVYLVSGRASYALIALSLAGVLANAVIQLVLQSRRPASWAAALAYPPLMGLIAVVIAAARGAPLIEAALILGGVYTSMLMTGVALLSTSRIYGVEPRPGPRLFPYLAATAALALYAAGLYEGALYMISLSLLLHVAATRQYLSPLVILRSGLRGVEAFIASGHVAAVLGAILTVYNVARGDYLLAVHSVYMGFLAGHVFVNSLLMLPVPGRKRFSAAPGLLLALALAARHFSPGYSWPLLIASIAALLLAAGAPGRVRIHYDPHSH